MYDSSANLEGESVLIDYLSDKWSLFPHMFKYFTKTEHECQACCQWKPTAKVQCQHERNPQQRQLKLNAPMATADHDRKNYAQKLSSLQVIMHNS